MKSSICVCRMKQNALLRIVLSIVTIVPLWLMLASAETSAYAQTTSSPGDRTQFPRDNMQRWNPYETVVNASNADSLKLKWKNPIGTYNVGGRSSPAVTNGVVYFASDDSDVYALNASTGAFIWSYKTAYIVSSSPAVVNGIVYFGGGADHNVYALNASTGAKLWSYATGGGVLNSPAVANGVVYIGSDDHNVYALDASTGALLWSYTTRGAVTSSPAVANGVVYVGSVDGNVYALNASTGTKLWSFPALMPNGISSPAVANGVVYIGASDGNVYALDASTGAKVWSFATGDVVLSSRAVANGVVYVGTFDRNVYALKAATGAKLWGYTIGLIFYCSPAVANGVVYIASSDGNVYALNAATGAKLWSYNTGHPNFSSPTIVNGVLYIRAGEELTGTGNVYAFTLGSADLFLRIRPSATTVHQGDLLTFAFPVWNLGPDVAEGEVLSNLQVPPGTTFDYLRIPGTPGWARARIRRMGERGRLSVTRVTAWLPTPRGRCG